MRNEDVQQLAIKLAAVTDYLEKRANNSVQAVVQSASSIHQVAQQAASSSEHLTRQAAARLQDRSLHGHCPRAGQSPIDACNQKLQTSAAALGFAADRLEGQMDLMRKAHLATAWKAFIASAIGSLAVAGYLLFSAVREVKRSEWVKAMAN